jgi:MFS family permease
MENEPVARRPGIYYGWMIVVLAAIAMAATLPSRTMGLGLITTRLLADLKISELQFSQMNLVATLAAAMFCWPCGWLIDRFGLRLVSAFTIFALGLVTILMSRVQSPAQLALTMILTRGIGQGALSVISITMVAKWFKRRLPVTMGLYAILMTILMTIGFVSATEGLKLTDWRSTWLYIGSILFATAAVTIIFTRDRRADESRVEFSEEQKVHEEGASLIDAIRSPTFWVFALSISFFGMVYAGISLFNESVLKARGFDETIYHNLMPVAMLIGLVFNLATGAAAQRISQSKLLAIALLVLGSTYAVFPWVTTIPQVYLYTVLNAAAGGMLTVLFFSIWGAAFGGQKLGQIQGLAQGLSVVASALGPICITIVKTETGSYNWFFFGAAFVSFLFAGFAAVIRVPSPGDFVDPQRIENPIPSTV